MLFTLGAKAKKAITAAPPPAVEIEAAPVVEEDMPPVDAFVNLEKASDHLFGFDHQQEIDTNITPTVAVSPLPSPEPPGRFDNAPGYSDAPKPQTPRKIEPTKPQAKPSSPLKKLFAPKKRPSSSSSSNGRRNCPT